MTCWAKMNNNCSTHQSREHLISQCIFPGRRVYVRGLPWCLRSFKKIGLDSLASNILCKKHNSELSPVDTEAKNLMNAIKECDRLHEVRMSLPRKMWSTRHLKLNGLLLERWFMKTTINLFCSLASNGPWPMSGKPSTFPPSGWVDTAFGRKCFAPPFGLYTSGKVGDQYQVEDHVGFQAIEDFNGNLAGASFEFSWIRFLLWLHPSDPAPPSSPLNLLQDYDGVNHLYHCQSIRLRNSFQSLTFNWQSKKQVPHEL